MFTSYRLKASELDSKFLQSIKNLFKGKEIEITVSEVDETEYLLRSEENKERLLQAVRNVKAGRNLKEVNLDDL